jgi:Uma2 family endonuclease
MATTAFVPIDEYLRSDYEPDAEYVDGEIEERPMGQFDHASWQQAIQLWFSARKREWNIRVLAEYRVKVAPARYRVPDVTVFDRARPIEQILTYPPIAVFEVLSPEDRMPRMLKKLKDYQTMGVQTIVVINPETDTIYRYRDGVLTPEEEPACPGSACLLDWTAIRELRD